MTKIEWTEQSWNPIVGCTIATPGCTNCYAMRTAHRLGSMKKMQQYHGLTKLVNGNPVWTGKIGTSQKALMQPLHRKKPTTYFVNSMGDLFHEDVLDAMIDYVFAVMALCPQHTFQVLTKRSKRMRSYLGEDRRRSWFEIDRCAQEISKRISHVPLPSYRPTGLPNVWLGVSVEDQRRADERIPELLNTPAAMRFVSAEPLLSDVDFNIREGSTTWRALSGVYNLVNYANHTQEIRKGNKIDWVICGGESGPGARPMHPDWARSLRDQCQAAQVPFFFKQWGEFAPEDAITDPSLLDLSGCPSLLDKPPHIFKDGTNIYRVGKKPAGRLLDGREWNEVPICQT